MIPAFRGHVKAKCHGAKEEKEFFVSPRVSILTPSFNQAPWLKDNLLSVENQTFPHIEHIVMDGGSTDGSIKILEQSGDRVRWRSERDRGQSHALNKAFEESKGEIIGWINSDDAYADTRAVEKVVKVFESNPDVGVVYGHGLVVNSENRLLHVNWAPPFSRSIFEYINFFVQPAAFVRRSVITPPLVDESLRYVMDRDLWLRLCDTTMFARVDAVIAIDRFQPTRKTLELQYPVEARQHMLLRGLDITSASARARLKLLKVVYRLGGARLAYSLRQEFEPAISLRVDNVVVRELRQLATRRKSMAAD